MAAQEVLAVEARLKDFISQNLSTINNNMKKFGANAEAQNRKAAKSTGTFNKAMGDAKQGVKNLAVSFGPAAIIMLGFSKIVGGVKAKLDLVRESTENFEATMSRVKAIVQPTTTEFNKLSKAAQEFGKNTVFTASQVGEAFVEMGKLGFKTNQIIKAAGGVLDLAAASQVSMAEASKVTLSTLKQFNLASEDSTMVVDIMSKSFTSSALDLDKFKQSMKFVGPIAKGFDISMKTTTATLETLAEQGIEASLAGTGLRFAMIELGRSSSKVGKLLSNSGSTATTFKDKLKDLKEMHLTTSQIMELFGRRAGSVANIIIKNTDSIERFEEGLDGARGSAKAMADTMLDNVKGASIKLKSAQEALGIEIGKSFSENKKKSIERATNRTKLFLELMKQEEGTVETFSDGLDGLSVAYDEVATNAIKASFSVTKAAGGIMDFLFLFNSATDKATIDAKKTDREDALKRINAQAKVTMNSIKEFSKIQNKSSSSGKFFGLTADRNIRVLKELEEKTLALGIPISDATDKMIKQAKAYEFATRASKGLLTAEELRRIEKEKELKLAASSLTFNEMELAAKEASVKKIKEEIAVLEEKFEINKLSFKKQEDLKNVTEQFRDETIKSEQEGAEEKRLLMEEQFAREKAALGNNNKAIELLDKTHALKRIAFDDAITKAKWKNGLNMASQAISSFKTIGQASKANALVMKRIAQGEAIVNTARAIAQVLPNIPLSFLVGAQGLAQVAIIERQKFAAGGISSGGPATVGEQGPELVVGPRNVDLAPGSRVFNNTETNNIMKPTNNYTLVIPSDSTISEDRLVETLENLNRDGQLENIKTAFSG